MKGFVAEVYSGDRAHVRPQKPDDHVLILILSWADQTKVSVWISQIILAVPVSSVIYNIFHHCHALFKSVNHFEIKTETKRLDRDSVKNTASLYLPDMSALPCYIYLW